MKKAQSANEFVILITAVFFIFLTLLIMIYGKMADRDYEKRDLAIKEIALTMQDEIKLAYKASDGYSRTFNFPVTPLDNKFDIMLDGDIVYIRSHDKKHSMALPTYDVIGQPYSSGTNVIYNNNGLIYLNVDPTTPVFRLTITPNPAGIVQTYNSYGINCYEGGDCYQDYMENTIVTLMSTPESGQSVNEADPFTGSCTNEWANSGKGYCNVTLSANVTLIHNYL